MKFIYYVVRGLQAYFIFYLLFIVDNFYILMAAFPIPVSVFKDQGNDSNYKTVIRPQLDKISGIYALVCKVDGKRYIGSAIDLYDRQTEHL